MLYSLFIYFLPRSEMCYKQHIEGRAHTEKSSFSGRPFTLSILKKNYLPLNLEFPLIYSHLIFWFDFCLGSRSQELREPLKILGRSRSPQNFRRPHTDLLVHF